MYRVSEREVRKLTNLIEKLEVSDNSIAKALLKDAERGIWHLGKTGVVQQNLYQQERVRLNLQQALILLLVPESNEFSPHSVSKNALLTNEFIQEQKPSVANNSLDNPATLLLGIPTYPEIEGYATSSDREFALHNFTGSETIKHSGEGHLITVAPTGTGKGRTAIIPNLLHYRGSVVVIDPKGENYAVTARYRREIGHQVIKIDPFGVINFNSDRLNPLDIFELENADLETDAQMLAELLSTGNKCRSYGVKVWSFWQDLAQIRQLYPQSWATIINNCAILQFFGSKNFKMSQEFSELVGVLAKDIRNLPQNEQIIVNNGVPLQAQRFDYLNHLQFKNRFDANPFHEQKSL